MLDRVNQWPFNAFILDNVTGGKSILLHVIVVRNLVFVSIRRARGSMTFVCRDLLMLIYLLCQREISFALSRGLFLYG